MTEQPHPAEASDPAEEPDLAEVTIENGDLLQLLWRLEHLKSAADAIKAEMKVVTMAIERQVHKVAIFTDPDDRIMRATVVRPDDKVVINLDKLRVLHPQSFERITKPVLDPKAWRKAMKAREIPLDVARQTMSFTSVSPYVTIKPVDAEGDDDEESTDD